MPRSVRNRAAVLAAADVAEALRALPGLRQAVTLAERAEQPSGNCPCPTCAENGARWTDRRR